MTSSKKSNEKATQQDELELKKKTLKDLPESGDEQKGGAIPFTITLPATPTLPQPGTRASMLTCPKG